VNVIRRVLGVGAALCAAVMPGAALAQGMLLWIDIGRDNPRPARPNAPIDNLQGLTDALRRCWKPPPADPAKGEIDVTFSISFKRSGELFGKPKVVIFAQPVTDEQRGRYYTAVAEALDLCSKLPFTDQMGGAVAGRVFRVNFLDKRNSRKAQVWLTTKTG
jgi:hypothetical protein